MLTTFQMSELICVSPYERPDASIVEAACRSGAVGVLDLGRDIDLRSRELSKLSRTYSGVYGVRVPLGVDLQTSSLPNGVSLVIFASIGQLIETSGLTRFVEVSSLEQAYEAIKLGIDGLIFTGAETAANCGETSTFMLLQEALKADLSVPAWFKGGFGLATGTAAIALGAQGIVLDSQLGLLEECHTPAEVSTVLESVDGSETRTIGRYRVFDRPDLKDLYQAANATSTPWSLAGHGGLKKHLLPLGQDACLAKGLRDRYGSLKRVIAAFGQARQDWPSLALEQAAIGKAGGLSKALGTEFPILQGPMTRVSDTVEFAAAVAEGGALPFLALALMRGDAIDPLLEKATIALGDAPWGVGILGFVPEQLRQEQLKVIERYTPPYCIIAGGRPSQAKALEAKGTKAYLHVPSPGLLDLFLKDGARRFIFEGRECGGHVGPRTSLLLWETQLQRLLSFGAIEDVEAVFAGGIHDDFSAAFIGIMATELCSHGAKVGVLMGTAYLFTEDAVQTGAILERYQTEAIAADNTVLLETAPGHATRCLPTPYVDAFEKARLDLQNDGRDPKEIWAELERLNVGRLRMASKGLARLTKDGPIEAIDDAKQAADGMYMIGQVAALRDQVTSIRKLHEKVAAGVDRIQAAIDDRTQVSVVPDDQRVALIGMACVYPGAPDKDAFWDNIVQGRNSVTEVPKERWDVDIYYDPDSMGGEKTPSKWGGFLGQTPFDPLEYGIPPKSLSSIEPIQLLSLQTARNALADAGYADRPFNKDKTSVIFGAEAGTELAGAYGFRAVYPQLVGELSSDLDERLPSLTEDSFPGVLANVIAGRIANRLDLGGVNYTVDAACASSLAALDLGIKELRSKTSDMVLCGGADLHNSINDYLLFSSVHALSRTGQCRSFDDSADGIVLGEGVAVVVLKRLTDAQRDGDTIYATINGVAGSSDGRHLGLTAPRSEGQSRALDRAYSQAGVSPADVGLVEAHGTGTVVGDKTELETVERVFRNAGAAKGQCALGSVKSNIGHTKCAAGLAGLMKIALSVYHRTLPATLNIETPNPAYDASGSPFTLSAYSRPWAQSARIAGVSAFGFGGTNFHAVVSAQPEQKIRPAKRWPSELFLFFGSTKGVALETAQQLKAHIQNNRHESLLDLAYSTRCCHADQVLQFALVAEDSDDLATTLDALIEDTPSRSIIHDTGIRGDVAFLMPGQGSQRPGMMAQLFHYFPHLHHYLTVGEEWLGTLFPPTVYTDEDRARQLDEITDTRVAQPALGIVDMATADLLSSFGIKPQMLAGHSYGELVGLWYAGCFDDHQLIELSKRRGEAILGATGADPGGMAAIMADADTVRDAISDASVVIANMNGPKQTVISGPTENLEAVLADLRLKKLRGKRIPVACAFHSPLVAGATDSLNGVLANMELRPPTVDVWSNTHASVYSDNVSELRETLADHVAKPVRFVEQISNMVDAGATIFVEVGPGRVLTGLVSRIAPKDETLLVATSGDGLGKMGDLLSAIGQLAVHGVSVDFDALFQPRKPTRIHFQSSSNLSPTTWLVNGQAAWPASELPPQALAPVGVAPSQKPGLDRYSEETAVVLGYLENMRQSVIDQRDVLLTYLGARPDIVVAAAAPERLDDTQQAPTNPVGAAPPEDEDETIEDVLVGLVSERTGYPPEMLDLDLDLEAALSIDSIKRIEILGALGEALGLSGTEGGAIESLVEELAAVKTLRGILEWLSKHEQSETDPPKAVAPEQSSVDLDVGPRALGRYTFSVTPAPLIEFNGLSVRDKSFALVSDNLGVALQLKTRMEDAGATVRTVQPGMAVDGVDGLIVLDQLSSQGTGSVFDTFKSVRSALMNGAFWVLGASGHGGMFGREANQTSDRRYSGLGGLLKSAAAEWPDARVRSVDLDPQSPAGDLAQQLYQELLADDRLLEVGYRDGQRFILTARSATHQGADVAALPLDEESVILVTGGARGITAHIAIAMAQRAKSRFILLGRTELDTSNESPQFLAARDPMALRRLLIEENPTASIADIEGQCTKRLGQRAIRATLGAIKDAGGQGEYHSVDVRDEGQLSALIQSIYQTHGRIDGAIHGAGVIEDKLIRHKTLESFRRVYETKVSSAQTLVKHLRDDIQFVAFFSSVAGAFGNRGQADYAAANDTLDKLAVSLNQSRAGRVLSINWGPWGGTGMVSKELESEYAKRGISLIGLDIGAEAFLDELDMGSPDDAQVVLMCAQPDEAFGRHG